VSHVEYAPHTILFGKKNGTDRGTDGLTPDRCIALTVGRANIKRIEIAN